MFFEFFGGKTLFFGNVRSPKKYPSFIPKHIKKQTKKTKINLNYATL